MIRLAPSILSADFSKLGEEIRLLENSGIEYLHADVMDGHFVHNISMGIPVIESIRKMTDMTLDVHLMISNPEMYIENFANAGADIINVHQEACVDGILSVVKSIKRLNKKAAVTIKPQTNYTSVLDILEYVDMVLVMSVEPGFGGQSLIPSTLSKVFNLANHISKHNLKVDIEVDGGVNASNISDVLNAGANVIVVGSAVFDAPNKARAIADFNDIIYKFEENHEGIDFWKRRNKK